jgi:hypothetical protein
VLELLFADGAAPASLAVLPHLPGAGTGALVRPLLDCAAAARRRVLPAPQPDTPAATVRRWYRDLWLALPERERAGLVVASGTGAACLATVPDRPVEVVAVVREPAEAIAVLAAAGARLPKQRALSGLEQGETASSMPWLRVVSNPQARALLLAWGGSEELPVTIGPPPDAERWRGLLFEHTAAMQVVRRAEFPAVAQEIAGRLGCPPEEVAASLDQLDGGDERVRNRQPDHMLALNWLDAELYEWTAVKTG